MPTDKLKPLARFPDIYSLPLQVGLGEYLIDHGETMADCKRLARHYRCFLNSIRNLPLHPFNSVLEKYSVRTGIRQDFPKGFSLIVRVNRKVEIPDY
jgi:hypothetical protein